jgi:putative DNA methylase
MPKLIERDFPFAHLSLVAERESWRKEVYRPVYYLHKWWARRLGSVFRGIVLGACLDDSENFWNRYYSKNSFDGTILFDPFMGSGVTIGEAIKLGCMAVGRDINPVAYVACRAAFSPFKSADVLRTYQQLEETLAPRLLSFFETKTDSGEKAVVLYYFLVKVVGCPQCGKDIDLFKTRIFSKNAVPQKDPSARALCPTCGSISFTFYNAKRVVCPHCSLSYNPQEGNINGQYVWCDACQSSFRLVDRMKFLGGPLGFRRYAKMIFTKNGQKQYEPLNDFDRHLERRVAEEFASVAHSFHPVAIESGYNTNQILKHNYKYWHQLFSDRQLVCIKHMARAIRGIEDPDLRLLFACLFSGALEFNNLFTSFKGEGTGAVRHMFAHHVLKPEMMPLEANIWGTNKSSGAFSCLFHSRIERALAYKSNPTELWLNSSKGMKVGGINHPIAAKVAGSFSEFSSQPGSVYLSCGDSSCVDLPDKSVSLVVTDPPFFDNVHYSQLADFFYYWLNQILDMSPAATTRCASEVQDTDSNLFTSKLTSVFSECGRVLRDDGLFIFTYHHSRHEGWTAVHRAIRHAGFVCTQAYPIKAEMSVSMPLQQAKSPIHLDLILVCRRDLWDPMGQSSDSSLRSALDFAKKQISSLKKVGIKVSLGDAKVILMGRFLCEAHRMRNLDLEEKFLRGLENDVDTYVDQVISVKGEVLYRETEPEQLRLFEEMGNYLAIKRLKPMVNRHT